MPKIYTDWLEFLFVMLLASLVSFLNPGKNILAVKWVFLTIRVFFLEKIALIKVSDYHECFFK